MKKILFALVFVLTISLSVSAQSDSFFSEGDQGYTNRNADNLQVPSGEVGKLKDTNGYTEPLGSGLLIMTALGAGYAVIRQSKSGKWKKA